MKNISLPLLVLTWNGNLDHYAYGRGGDPTVYARDMACTAAGVPTDPLPWGIGNTKMDIPNGTKVVILRQGEGPRGIVASGYVVNGTNHERDHFAVPGKKQNCVLIVLDHVVDADEPLPVADLQQFIPWHKWSEWHRASGLAVTDWRTVALLEILWTNRIS
jgi:hypothetical protein